MLSVWHLARKSNTFGTLLRAGGLRVTLVCAVHAKTHAYAQKQSQVHVFPGCCLLLQELLQRCAVPRNTKLCAWGEGDSGLRTCGMGYNEQRLVWGLVCPSRSNERMGQGYCVKGGWREEAEIVKERAWCLACPCALHTALAVDHHRVGVTCRGA